MEYLLLPEVFNHYYKDYLAGDVFHRPLLSKLNGMMTNKYIEPLSDDSYVILVKQIRPDKHTRNLLTQIGYLIVNQ